MNLPTFTAGNSRLANLYYGVGALWSSVNLASWGANSISMTGPILLGLAALWQARTAHRRLVFEYRRTAQAEAQALALAEAGWRTGPILPTSDPKAPPCAATAPR